LARPEAGPSLEPYELSRCLATAQCRSTAPETNGRVSRSFSFTSADSNSRAPRPTTTGNTNSRYSSTSPAAISAWTSCVLPVATMSRPGAHHEAALAYRAALELADNEAERRFLSARLAESSGRRADP
jgi:hypothetical protein